MFDLKQLRKQISDINLKVMLIYTQMSRFLVTSVLMFNYASDWKAAI